MGQYCCKSRKGQDKDVGEASADKPTPKPIEVKDYIHDMKLEEGFKQYCETNFDLKNREKYLIDEKLGLFSFECITKIFMASFVWKNIVMDKAQGPFLQQRRDLLRQGDDDGYKATIKTLEKLEESIF